MKDRAVNCKNLAMISRLSHTQSGQLTSEFNSMGPLAEISPRCVSSPSSTARPMLALPKPKPARGTKRKLAKTPTRQAQQPAKRAKNSSSNGSTKGRQNDLQGIQTQHVEGPGRRRTRASLVQPPLREVQEAAAVDSIEALTQEDIVKLLPGSQHGHATDIFTRGFWSTDLERDLRSRLWTDADEEALFRSCPAVSVGELYVWRAMPRLFGCNLPDLYRYGLSISFYPDDALPAVTRRTEPNAPSIVSGVTAVLLPNTTRGSQHETATEEYFKALARLLAHPIWRGDPSRLRYVLQQAVRARVGPAQVEPLVPPYSKASNNFAEFAWTCCSAPDTSRPLTREVRDRELGLATRWMADMYVTADRELCDVVDNLLEIYGHNVHYGDKQPQVDVHLMDAKPALFDLQLCDLHAVYRALERTPQTVDRDPNHEPVSAQLYAPPARFFIDDLKSAPDITNGDSRQVLAKWMRDQKRDWILSRRREDLIRQRMQAAAAAAASSSSSSLNPHERSYLLDIPAFDPDGRYHTWPDVTEGELAVIQGLVTRTGRCAAAVDNETHSFSSSPAPI